LGPRVPSVPLRLLLAPRTYYRRPDPPRPFYIVSYVLFTSLLIGCAASVASTNRITLPLALGLAVSWMFVPLTQVLIAAIVVATARAPRIGGTRAIALLLRGHAPWSLFLVGASAIVAIGGYPAYRVMTFAAIVPLLLTLRIVHAFAREVLDDGARGAVARALAHQALTWFVAAVYLDKAVGLVPRIQGWLS
jgi:hypothetical protein